MRKLDDFSPERLADRAQIQDVMHRWSRAVDRQDFDEMRVLFHSDAFDSHGVGRFEGGVEELIDWIRVRHAALPFTLHSLSNMIIEFSGPDSAIVETVVTGFQRSSMPEKPERSTDIVSFGRYADRFERRNGEWRIQHRVLIMDSQMLLESGAGSIDPGIISGVRDQGDYIFQFRKEAGL